MRGLLARLGLRLERDARLAEIAAVWGTDRVEEALDVALEAGKLGLRAEDLADGFRARSYLEIAGKEIRPGEGFVAWARRTGAVSAAELRGAAEVDLLGMRDPAD